MVCVCYFVCDFAKIVQLESHMRSHRHSSSIKKFFSSSHFDPILGSLYCQLDIRIVQLRVLCKCFKLNAFVLKALFLVGRQAKPFAELFGKFYERMREKKQYF